MIDRLYTVDRLDSVLCLAEFSFWSSNWSLCSGKGRRARCRHSNFVNRARSAPHLRWFVLCSIVFPSLLTLICLSIILVAPSSIQEVFGIPSCVKCNLDSSEFGQNGQWQVMSERSLGFGPGWCSRFEDILNFETFPSIFKPSKWNPLTQKRQHPRRRQRRRSPRLPVVLCLWP